MPDAPKVCYAITEGCYSSYEVRSVFLSREMAEKALALIPNNNDGSGYGSRIEEFPLDDLEAYERYAKEYREKYRLPGER